MSKYKLQKYCYDKDVIKFLIPFGMSIDTYYSNLKIIIEEAPYSKLLALYRLLYGKKKTPTDEDLRKSIFEYAKSMPKEMRERLEPILKIAPKPPNQPNSSLLKESQQ